MFTYNDAVAYMMEALPMYSRIGPQAFKKDLTNTLALCEHLGNPQQKLKFIHIAGTNGKGSVSHILASLFATAGCKTGLYTSPHYLDYRERIKINGCLIAKKFVTDFIQKNRTFLDQLKPSYFEMTVGLALLYFAEQEVDIVVLETGLGGRLDSTNIITPLLSVITNISYDHMDLLGNTLEAIATEKAGIIKHKKPVIIGESQLDTNQVFNFYAKQNDAPIYYAEEIIHVSHPKIDKTGFTCFIDNLIENSQFQIKTDLYGDYQLKNIRTALGAWHTICSLYGYDPDTKIIQKALINIRKNTYFIGRMQWLSFQPKILADSAHNEAGVTLLISEIKEIPYKQLRIVWGTVNDKDVKKVLSKLPKEAIYYFAKANIPRGKDAHQLLEEAKEFGIQGKAFNSVQEAYQTAKKEMLQEDLLVVSGSIFVVAEVI
jgi:dihydrofolate synthase / folylpolyglutamate synthase